MKQNSSLLRPVPVLSCLWPWPSEATLCPGQTEFVIVLGYPRSPLHVAASAMLFLESNRCAVDHNVDAGETFEQLGEKMQMIRKCLTPNDQRSLEKHWVFRLPLPMGWCSRGCWPSWAVPQPFLSHLCEVSLQSAGQGRV